MTNLALPIDQAARHTRTGNDRTTPQWILDEIPDIALDPCSNPWSIVKAAKSYSKHRGEDGLAADWKADAGPHQLVYCNPPYGDGLIMSFADKIDREARRGVNVATLVPLDPTTEWWAKLTAYAVWCVLLTKRVQFGGGGTSNPKPSAMVIHNGYTLGNWSKLGQVTWLSGRAA